MEESGSRLEVGGSRVGVGADGALTANPSSALNLQSSLESSHSSAWLAWCYLVWFCFLRQARARQMVWIALALLTLITTVVGLVTLAGRVGMEEWRWTWVGGNQPLRINPQEKAGPPVREPPIPPHYVRLSYAETAQGMQVLPHAIPMPSSAAALQDAVAGATRIALARSRFYLFSNWVVFSVFVGFLLPIWSLSFATEALGGEREGRSLVWLLTRPLPRASIYLAKFFALLPWSLALNLGGFALICAVGGWQGHLAFRLYWPAVLGGTIAFCALFHLMGACFRRAAVIALVYSFFLETILGSMPGYMKRISIGFYTRCLMFDAAAGYGVQPEKPSIYLPVSAATAWSILFIAAAGLLVVGMIVFARTQYQDLS
ncbi:MAG TPA: ABC transporter permease [Gemmataceae bacterium]|nr:ABC transporter permease [Gemmataceae bacterium]